MASWKAARVALARAMDGASGSSAIRDCGSESPPASSAISMSSRFALSEPPAQMIDRTRAAIRLRLG